MGWQKKEDPKEIIRELRIRGIPITKDSNIITLWHRLMELTGRNAPDPFLFGKIGLRVGKNQSAETVEQGLIAEVSFYENLYRGHPEGKFSVSLKRNHTWPDGEISTNVIVFECPPGTPMAYTSLMRGVNNRMIMAFFQGEKGTDPRKVNKILGKPLFRAFMDHIISSFRPLHNTGVKLVQVVSEASRDSKLPKKIRRKYFDAASELDPKKVRVRKLLK